MNITGYYLVQVGQGGWLCSEAGDIQHSGGVDSYIKPLQINSTGVLIWKAIQQGQPAEEISMNISQIYGIPYSEASEDVNCFLESLIDRGIIVTARD